MRQKNDRVAASIAGLGELLGFNADVDRRIKKRR